MKNIWFIRTDKDGHDNFDVTAESPFIYSLHGICGEANSHITKHKDKVFPKLVLGNEELLILVRTIKKQLIDDGIIDPSEGGKARCDLAIRYWIAIMEEGDIVFVRNKQQEVLVCKVTGYVSESFFDKNGSFQRPVEILGSLTKEPIYEEIWKRTKRRNTIERNANGVVRALVFDFLRTLKS